MHIHSYTHYNIDYRLNTRSHMYYKLYYNYSKEMDLLPQTAIGKSRVSLDLHHLSLLHQGDNQVPCLHHISIAHRKRDGTVSVHALAALKVTTGTYFDPRLWGGTRRQTCPFTKYLFIMKTNEKL